MFRRIVFAAVAAVMTVGPIVPASAQTRSNQDVVTFTVDVAEDLAGKFVPTLVHPDDAEPKRGAFYITGGRLFPAGTIQGDGADFNPYQRGHIGIWISRGTHLVAASELATEDLWASTAQLFVIGRQAKEQLTSEGLEGNGTLTRVVTGGTGNYAGFIGEQRQTFLGVNPTGGVNLRVTFVLRRVR
jgi:hypothetical protein